MTIRNNTSGNTVLRKLMQMVALAVAVLILPQLAGGVGATAPSNPGPNALTATQDFQDVPTTDPFYNFLHKIGPNGAQIVGGYTCGELGEPCVAPGNMPYYRPGNSVTRLQMSKFVDLARSQPGININTTTSILPLYSGTTAVDGVGVKGESASGMGVQGISSSGTGVYGSSTGIGVYGASINERGVYGFSTNNIAVYGTTGSSLPAIRGENTGSGVGVQGNGNTGNGVYGISTSGAGVRGSSTNSAGVVGASISDRGVYGISANNIAVYGTTGSSLPAIRGENTGGGVGVQGNGNTGNGVYGQSAGGNGIYGTSVSTNTLTDGGVYGISTVLNGNGIIGEANNGSLAFGVWGKSTSGYAGYFEGNVLITGTCTGCAMGDFEIDNPIDPANKYLRHSTVASPDMLDIYTGNVTTDANGNSIVVLPDYFEALNKDFRYQLTVIGQFAQAIVTSEIQSNHFTIKTDKPNVKVSWQVTGIRHDPYAEQHPVQAEESKPDTERGYYLHPELYGQPSTRQIGPATENK